MKPLLQRTLVICKPDAVQRQLCGRILSRFEEAGFKIIAAKFIHVAEEFARKHYADLAERRGEKVAGMMVSFLASGPVLAFVLEGADAVENVRKLVGTTEPKAAAPGTIRGDFSHVSFPYADKANKAIANLVHASGNAQEAEQEIKLWFSEKEACSYTTVLEGLVR